MTRLLRLARHGCAALTLGALLGSGAGFAQDVLLYVPAQSGNQLWEYSVATGTGILTPFPTQATNGVGPSVVGVSPNNRFMYAGNSDGTIDAFVVNYNGTLTAVGPPFANSGSVRGFAFDPTGKFLYSSHGTGSEIRVFSVNQTTGRLTEMPGLTVSLPAASAPRGVVTDAAGHLYITLSNTNLVAQYSINSVTGALTQIAAPVAAGLTPDRLVLSPDGAYLYVANYFGLSISIFAVTPGSGALTAVGAPVSTGTPSRPLGMAVHPTGKFLVVALNSSGLSSDNVQIYSIGAGGALTLIGTATAGSLPAGVSIEPNGNFVYVSNSGSATVTRFVIDQTTGALSAPAPNTFATGTTPQFLIARPVPVPQVIPTLSGWSLASLAVLLAGSSLLLRRQRRRRA